MAKAKAMEWLAEATALLAWGRLALRLINEVRARPQFWTNRTERQQAIEIRADARAALARGELQLQ